MTKRHILIAGIVAALAAGGYGYYEYNRAPAQLTQSKADASLTAEALFATFEADEAQAETQYLDKVLEVTGTVREVLPQEAGLPSVMLEVPDALGGVLCELDPTAKHRRTEFTAGEAVTLKGLCTGMLMDVVLVRCVEVGE